MIELRLCLFDYVNTLSQLKYYLLLDIIFKDVNHTHVVFNI